MLQNLLCLTSALSIPPPHHQDPERHALLHQRLQDADAAFEAEKGGCGVG